MTGSSRFSKYQPDDLPALIKLGENESSKPVRLVGDHETTVTNDNGPQVLPVLDLIEVESGEPCAFMSGARRWLDALSLADPQPGDVLVISRGKDIGRERDIRIEILESAAAKIAESDVTPAAGDDPVPF